MVLIIIGIILIGIGVFLYFNRQNALNKSMDVRYYETSKVKDLIDTYKSISAELGAGMYSAGVVEIKGIGNTDNPLVSEHTQTECLYFESAVERKYEVQEQYSDSDGNYRTRTVTRTDTVSSNRRSTPFYINDGSGEKILVNPEGADIDAEEVLNTFQVDAPLNYIASSILSNSRTLGYTYRESVIPLNANLYVLGEIADRAGKVGIVKPKEAGKQFIVSMKSEDQIVADAETSAAWQLYGGIGLGIVGIILIIAGIL
ncbi:MAG: hypothetical protein EAZ85_09505 [Bacteroidetes bacterium]|nr:MAG: hypothetical protein EAZ85_09505 [Bacteroidota bacterium]TAG88567.1 MAG: hypothetical protein EAZ20_08245 [Bacteroidota bacterium]